MANLTLLTDFYELTMMQGYFDSGMGNKRAVFDMFFRQNPSGGGYSIFAGLEQLVEYIEALRFSPDDLSYLNSLGMFSDEFLEYLREFRFTGDIYAASEGEVIFPGEPIVTVKSKIMEAQLIESALLNIINHQSLIATKAARVVTAAGSDPVLEFGLRRAQGPDAGVFGARAAMIGGCSATSNVLCGRMFDVPVKGTHAHSWVMSFPDELTAFRSYVKAFPDSCMLLIDTYNTINSGLPNAIKVFDELKASGHDLRGIGVRLDSGDLAFMSKTARKILDEAGYKNAVICASSDLDEYLIQSLKVQGAAITVWGVGTNLITSHDCPAFGGVYKLVGLEADDGSIEPKIKLSENPDKVTNPGEKKVFRLTDNATGKIKADLIALEHENVDETQPITVFDPKTPWKTMTLKAGEYSVRELLAPVFVNGTNVHKPRKVMDIREYCTNQKNALWDEHKRFINPQLMPVDLSEELYELKHNLISRARTGQNGR